MAQTFRQLAKITPKLLQWGNAVELQSAPGRGKSSFIEQTVARMNAAEPGQWGCATAFLGTYSPIDLPGFMIPVKLEGGGYMADYTRPAWMTTRDGKSVFDYPKGILFLDEFGQADPDVKKSAADLMLNKRVGKWQLPPGWVVWAASNRASDRSGVTKQFDFVINRRMQIEIADDVTSLEEYFLDVGVHPLIIAFMRQNPQIVFTDGVPDQQGPWMTPRTLHMAADMLTTVCTDQERLTVDGSTTELVGGLVGMGAAVTLMSFLKLYDKLPTFEEVVASPGNAKRPDTPDAQMTICYALAGKVDDKTIDPVIAYMKRMPAEFAVTFVKAAVRRDGNMVNTRAMGAWLRDNASLVAAVAAARG